MAAYWHGSEQVGDRIRERTQRAYDVVAGVQRTAVDRA
jgi:hypothetical protein